MKRAIGIVLLLVLVVFLGLWLSRRNREAQTPAQTEVIATNVTVNESYGTHETHEVLMGETILRGYANTNLPPENDLTLMSRLMENSLLLLKAAANRPLSANEDWADLLRGRNAAHERFLPDQYPALNAQGQLVDRWNSPLFIHALGNGRYEIRSAGPDRKLWTDDDIHRNSDGSFRHGAQLNPPALFDSATERK